MSLFARSMVGLNRDLLLAGGRSRALHVTSPVIKSASCQLRTLSTTTEADTGSIAVSTPIQPRASNPTSFQRSFFGPESYHQNKNRKKGKSTPKISWRMMPRPGGKIPRPKTKKVRTRHLPKYAENKGQTIAQQLIAGGETLVPKSTWVLVEAITPTSTLEAMLIGVRTALDTEQTLGMIDLDAVWSPGQEVPCLKVPVYDEDDENPKWVSKARLILSPFGRPTGWYLKFENRSVVYALLKYAQETAIRCTWREVRVRAYAGDGDPTESAPENPNFHFNDQVSDNTIRVENCPTMANETTLVNFFSRYDLRPFSPINRWDGVTSDGKPAPCMFLVHFADAAWARAAIREKQCALIQMHPKQLSGKPPLKKDPKPIILVQYPRQIL